jgi:hypothetical protein
MIRQLLLGRTGNILFQYALGRLLSIRHGVPLVLDAAWYNRDGWNDVSHLLSLPIHAVVIRRFSLAARALRNATGGKHHLDFTRVPVFRENPVDHTFDKRFLEVPSNCLLAGFFQSHHYFAGIDDLLRDELTRCFAKIKTDSVPGLGERGSVAVHVRRGDYLIHPAFSVCGLNYYHVAMEKMRAEVEGAKFFIFSDDAPWCREVLAGPDVVVVSRDGDSSPLRDMKLMAGAAHHIICNSSFSWWAAWLAKHPAQKVLMPNRWYTGEVVAPIEEKCYDRWETLDPG